MFKFELVNKNEVDTSKITLWYSIIWKRVFKEYFQCLQLAQGDETTFCATIFRQFTELGRGRSSVLDEEHTMRPLSLVIPENVLTIRKMLIDDNRCTYQMTQKELYMESAAIYKFVYDELNMKKNSLSFVI